MAIPDPSQTSTQAPQLGSLTPQAPQSGGLTFPTIAIVNTPSSGVANTEVQAMVAAMRHQLVNDFGPAWRTGAHLRFVPSTSKAPAGAWVIALLDNSDQAGALGYHDLTPDGYPLGKVFAGTDRQYGETISVTLNHELLEMLADPYINQCVQADDGAFYALEVCDAVEADAFGYEVGGVLLSNFVTPAWFGHGGGRLDHLGQLSQPFQLAPGGYISVFDPANGQGWTQVSGGERTADGMVELLPFKARPRVGSRRERRFTPRDKWLPSTYETDIRALTI